MPSPMKVIKGTSLSHQGDQRRKKGNTGSLSQLANTTVSLWVKSEACGSLLGRERSTMPIVRASLTYLQHVILLLDLCLDTDFCSGDHNPSVLDNRKESKTIQQ